MTLVRSPPPPCPEQKAEPSLADATFAPQQPRACSSPVLAWAGGIKTTSVSPSSAAAGTPWVVCRAPAGWFSGKGENEEPRLGELFQLRVQQELAPGAISPRSPQRCVRNARAGPSYFCIKRLMEPNTTRAYLQGKHGERSSCQPGHLRLPGKAI